MLDRVNASPTRQFAVKMLHLSDQEMRTKHLEGLVELMRKKKNAVYHIDNSQLNDIVKPQASAQTFRLLRDVIAVASDTLVR